MPPENVDSSSRVIHMGCSRAKAFISTSTVGMADGPSLAAQRSRTRRFTGVMQMFSLTIVDHVRLDSEQVDKNYMVHAKSAERMVRAVFACRIGIIALLAVAVSVALLGLLLTGTGYQIAT